MHETYHTVEKKKYGTRTTNVTSPNEMKIFFPSRNEIRTIKQNDANDVKDSRRHFPGRCRSVWPTIRSHGMDDLWRELHIGIGQHRTDCILFCIVCLAPCCHCQSIELIVTIIYNIIVQYNICD